LSKFVALHEESNHEIVHGLRLGEAQRTADEALAPGPQIDMCALTFLGVLLAYLMLRGIERPLVSPPAVGGELRDATWRQQLLALQEDVVLSPSELICQDRARVMINGVPQPARVRFAAYVPPHCIQG